MTCNVISDYPTIPAIVAWHWQGMTGTEGMFVFCISPFCSNFTHILIMATMTEARQANRWLYLDTITQNPGPFTDPDWMPDLLKAAKVLSVL